MIMNLLLYHIEAETKWLPFSRWHFQMHFLELQSLYFDGNFIEICSPGSNQQYSSIGSDYGLIKWCIHASLSLSELNCTKASLEDSSIVYLQTYMCVFMNFNG